MMKRLLIALGLVLVSAVPAAELPKILLVVTNHAELGDSGKKTGLYLSEAAEPFGVLR